ncbi:MAG: hypothetical protein K2L67_06710 [Clostridia bacterium]|nr:hypothetical protein [Clostridia bacterium]
MQEKNFASYEYMTKSVKAKDQTRVVDMYEAFGWELTSSTPAIVSGTVTLSFKRDRKINHKHELNKLERQAEETFQTINTLNASKTLGASIFAYVFGVIAILVLGGGMCMTMLTENNVPAFVGGIILGIVGIALCSVNYFIYKKLAERKIKQVLPVIDETEEKLANILEKGNGLLCAETI